MPRTLALRSALLALLIASAFAPNAERRRRFPLPPP
jgi:hypothetical protein